MKYREKPVVIDAYQTDEELDIETLEGTMHASVGDYIITGVNGEQYPCKPDIFAKTYEPADTPASPWHRMDEPPKEEGKYLVYNERGNYHVAWWGKRLGWCYDPKYFCYWMPIEPPKEDA